MNPLLKPLAAGYRAGVALRGAAYRRGWWKSQRLSRPVISVGNLTAGGTGKTPFVALLAERLLRRGWKPGILTRGYGRPRRAGEIIAIQPGAERGPDPRAVGDEPALLARKLPEVAIVVGADRYRAGCVAEERFGVDVHILDDGFQHLALERDLDITLLDVTEKISDGALLPAGRMREPWSALERAHLIVLTRTELDDAQPYEALARETNPQAKVLRCRTKLCQLVDVRTGESYPPTAFQGKPVCAFCGLGNPEAFFGDLRKWGFTVAGATVFPDHYVYPEQGLRLLLAEHHPATLLTTEKDAMNLPAPCEFTIPLLACVIQLELLEPDDFESEVFARLNAVAVPSSPSAPRHPCRSCS